jgi:D-beta-D-heptose 7-phosphate kinase/D-beta-D-heptose 1-phosphate adenosyltransferase
VDEECEKLMVKIQALTEALARFVDTKVLVIGDLMIDEYVWGHVNRISPEAPVQVVEAEREEYTLGGAGNVVKNLVSLEARVFVSSVVDPGDTGRLIRSSLRELAVDCSGMFEESSKISSRKTRILSLETNQQILRIDHESIHPLSRESEKRMIDYIEGRIESFGAVVISDYLKGVLSDNLVRHIIVRAKEKEVPVVVDPKGSTYDKYRNATLITPNRKEVETVLNTRIDGSDTLERAGRNLLKKLGTEAVLITLGKDGMALFRKGKKSVHVTARKKEVFDVTGAGDTVISLIGLGIASGLDLMKSIEIANIAAGIVVGKIGTATVTRQEIIDELLQHTVYASNKIVELDTLVKLVEDRRKRGRIIVFTNGCFDILHIGHTSFLQQARQRGDLLIVGLNSDDSVRRLKGPHRPIVPMKERAAILSSLAGVDYITVFDEDTPVRLIRTLKPDVLVKGDDYKIEEVVGKDIVESYGGRVELIKLVRGVSTTSIIERIVRTANRENQGRK